MSEKIDLDLEKIEKEASIREELNNKKTQDLIEKEVEKRIAEAEARKVKEAEAKAKDNELEQLRAEKETLVQKQADLEKAKEDEIKELKSKMGSSKGANQSPFDKPKGDSDTFNPDEMTSEERAEFDNQSKALFLEHHGIKSRDWDRKFN